MALDQNSMAMDLRPLNVVRSGAEESRIGPSPSPVSTSGYYQNMPRIDVATPPLYYTDASPNIGFAAPPTWWAPRPPSTTINPAGYGYSPNMASRLAGGAPAPDHVSEDGGDDSVSGKKVKFLCSFGGKILPRPSDGMLRYVGGQTRIISVRKDVTFGELVQKMIDTYDQPVVIKYQLPDEDLDALVSVSCSDDLDNMMEEFEKLQERSPDGSAKLRVFLFTASELDPSGLLQLRGLQDTGQRYVDAVNGVAEGIVGGITRKGSIASVASTQNSDVSGSEVFETVVSQDVGVPPSANMFSPRGDTPASYDNNPPLMVPVGVSPHSAPSQPEIEQESVISVPTHGQYPIGYDLSNMNFQPPYSGGYIDQRHHQDTLNRGASHVVYSNPQVMGAPRPMLIHPQYRDSPNLLNQQFVPAVQMTMTPTHSHMSMHPNMLQPLVQPSHRVVADKYNNAYQAPVGSGGYRWPQVPPQDPAAFSQGWVAHQQEVPTTADCYMCSTALPHAHSDSVVQDQKTGQSPNVSDTNSIYQSLRLDDITRLHAVAAQNQNQGLMGLANDVQNPYCAPEDVIQQQRLVTIHANCDSAVTGVAYHAPEDYSVKVPVNSREDAVRSVIVNDQAKPLDFRMEKFQMKPIDILPSSEHGKPHIDQFRKDEVLEQVPNSTFVRPTQIQETSQLTQTEMAPSPIAEISPDITIADAIRIPGAETIALNSNVQPSTSPHNWGAVGDDSANSLFSNQDPWNMRHETHFPPPKPSKIVTKREAFPADNRQNGEPNADANFVDVQPTTEQVQSGKGSADERIKQQLQATAEGVAASVLHSSVPSNVDFSSQETSFSEVSHEIEGQTNSDAALQTKTEAMNIKSDKANIGLPLSDGVGRLQIIKNGDLEELRELGSGTFGTVYHGKWRGTDVAIKRINDRCFAGKPSEQERMRDDFWNEAIKLADLHHPNVVAFYGVVRDGPGGSVATVTEYMVNGSLRTALQKNEKNLDKRKRILIAMDVAFGMEYLHSKNIVHFDLKSDNLLVNLRDPHRPICKVGDLGLSKVKCQTLISGGVRGTLPWMAPELLNGSSSLVSEKVDVFSFGIVMWEILTGEEPYADLHYGAIIGGIVSNTLRPPVPEGCDPEWRSLMERCWSADPPERPNFTEIANDLRSMATKIPVKGQTPAITTRTNT